MVRDFLDTRSKPVWPSHTVVCIFHSGQINVEVMVEAKTTSSKHPGVEPLGVTAVDAGLTQAEYERVVKGVKLSDPVDAEISRSCTSLVYSLSHQPSSKTLYYGCYNNHVHSAGPDDKERTEHQLEGRFG